MLGVGGGREERWQGWGDEDNKGIPGMDVGEIEQKGKEMVLKVGETVKAGKPDKGLTQNSTLDSTDSWTWLRVSLSEKQN